MNAQPARLVRASAHAIGFLALVLLVPACGGQSAKTTEPAVESTLPSPGASGVALQTVIYINWDRALDASTVDTSTFVLTDGSGNQKGVTVSYNAVLEQVWMAPTSALTSSTTYTVTIRAGVEPQTGVTYPGGAFQFTTTSGTDGGQPTFGGASSASPTSATAGSLDLVWSAGVDTVDGDGLVYDIYLTTTAGGEDFSTTPFKSVTSSTGTTITGLATGVKYYFIVRARETTSGNIEFNTNEVFATPT
jgi:hypothetical protein